ncbi:MAG: YabP/YqfC family sporulation protein [Oscillospiraceae bacterium]
MQKNLVSVAHNVIIESRKTIRVSGVNDIDSLTESRAILSTVMGEIVVKGEDLHVVSLNEENGDLIMSGKINSLTYSNNSILDGPIKKLFR